MQPSSADVATEQAALEQAHLDLLYSRLDKVRAVAEHRLRQSQRQPIAGTPGNRTERDALVAMYANRVRVLDGVDDRLCFGRLDLDSGSIHYIGRIGLLDESNNSLLLDWRADAAAVFYQATAANPRSVVRRRHIATSERQITGLDDDVLILDALTDRTRATVTGHDSLLTAIDAARTGHMRDIVSTIQAEQDRIIRSDLRGVLIVQGGPGTGKTVVALHRVAYLLYANRDRISRSGALIIGPNDAFVSYIDRVLPALGETGVLLRTLGQLFPGVKAHLHDEPGVAAIKGDHRMTRVLVAAIRARQKVPAAPIKLRVDGSAVMLTPADVAAARRRARDTRKPHNEARVVFVRDLLVRLAGRLAKSLRINLDDDTRLDLVADLRDSIDVRREINLCWMPVTPQQLLADLLADPVRLAEAAPYLTYDERAAMSRPQDSGWTVSDVALLDEAAELLGDWDPRQGARDSDAAAQRAADVDFARSALANSGAAAKMMTAEQLADRFRPTASLAPVAERAAKDRQWAFGHVVIDEAQELSQMQWRMVMRHCPSRSMTIVGDPAQTGSAAGVGSWTDAMRPYVPDRWRMEKLTINYRTPAMIMEAAAAVLAAADVDASTPQSVRPGTWPPQLVRLTSPEDLAVLLVSEAVILGSGTLAIIGAEADQELLIKAAAEAEAAVSVMVSTVAGVKGLEFDGVVVFEPAAIVEESPRPAQDLYVAMTRPTQRLTFAHVRPLPELLNSLR